MSSGSCSRGCPAPVRVTAGTGGAGGAGSLRRCFVWNWEERSSLAGGNGRYLPPLLFSQEGWLYLPLLSSSVSSAALRPHQLESREE